MFYRLLKVSILAGLFMLMVLPTVPASESDFIYVLKKTDNDYVLETLPVPSGQVLVLTCGPGSDIVDIILPVGPGGSGSIVQNGQTQMIIVINQNGIIKHKLQKSDGKTFELPDVELDDLRQYDIYVSVTGYDGTSSSFVIHNYAEARPDDIGPVMDMFAGQVPLNKGEFSLMTTTARSSGPYRLSGQADLDYSGHYLFTEAYGPDGRKGLFVVDIGAANSLVKESFLPTGTETEETFMMEYSSGGARKLKYSPRGATGTIENIIGTATLSELRLGDITVRDARVDVYDDFPDIDGREVDGIIGMDIMKSAPYLTLSFDRNAKLKLSDKKTASGKIREMSFVTIGEAMYALGEINNKPVHFLLDTGSPECMLPAQAAKMVDFEINSDSTLTYRGASEQKAEAIVTELPDLKVAGTVQKNISCHIGDVFVLQTIRPNQATGLMGNSLFSKFASMEFDFRNNLIRFTEK